MPMDVYQYGTDTLPPPMRQAFESLYQHLTRGNDGQPWCRWCEPAVDRGTFYVCDARHLGGSLDQTVRSLGGTLHDLALRNNDGPSFPRSYKLLGWYSLTGWIDVEGKGGNKERRIQALRSELLRRGMVVGFVHPESRLKSLTGAGGYPYRFDESFVNVRFATRKDKVFVEPNKNLIEIFKHLDL